MERTIRVTGKGNISLKPDQIRLVITQTGLNKEYDQAVKESTEQKGQLNKKLEKIGFEKKDLKTLSFNIDSRFENYQTADKEWKRRFVGYAYSHRMKLEFPADNERLGIVLYALAHFKGKPEFSIHYTVSDPEAAKNALLAKAVADAKEKASVLSSAAGVSLGMIELIDYSWGQIEFESRPFNNMALFEGAMKLSEPAPERYDIDIDPDDIDVSDTVTVVWQIA